MGGFSYWKEPSLMSTKIVHHDVSYAAPTATLRCFTPEGTIVTRTADGATEGEAVVAVLSLLSLGLPTAAVI